jgi:hypothetical protein
MNYTVSNHEVSIMQTLKLSVSLPDDTHPDMELRLSANDASCDVVIALPLRPREVAAAEPEAGASAGKAANAADDYVLGGYAGI